MNSKYRYVVPNGLSFLSLTCGVASILLSTTGALYWAGILILVSYILDLCDGAAARTLKARSAFGLQLDSLVDMVSLGTAPAVLLFTHLRAEGVGMVWIWPTVILIPLAGAFRLARFNLLPPKEHANVDSVGLTISTGGATITLAVLCDVLVRGEFLPDLAFVPLIAVVCLLMVSTVAFPSLPWIFANRRRNLILLILFSLSLILMSFFHAWFFWTNAYLGVALARAGYKTFHKLPGIRT